MTNPSPVNGTAVSRREAAAKPMKWGGFDVVCPRCRGPLSGDAASLSCVCGGTFPVDTGIPDMRVFADPYISIEDDRAKGRHLASRFQDFDFAGLVAYYYSITPAVRPEQA